MNLMDLANEHDALILAHNYQTPEIQDVAHHVGDSLALAKIAAESQASTIVLCGVYFMAETTKILSPEKRVIIPEPEAGCSLASSITAEQLRAWKAEHPEAAVVAYVNTTAEVKALSDVCCTSSNAVRVVESIDPDRDILFLPDQFLGAHVQRETGRKNIHVWLGECHVHADISPTHITEMAHNNPQADLYVHPECGCTTSALWLASQGDIPQARILSTGGMMEAARKTAASTVLVATEIGMLHQLRKANTATDFIPVNPHAACPFMQMITMEKLEKALVEGHHEVHVDPVLAQRARGAVEAMITL
ncbi:quinolinate synthase NadA [Corynebacterium diphtheriae]|uniref:quinolinate synthase NadA n=1 Tax=Corynebacterium diphtheriae TaxID=1717 RepID=UPI0002EB2105|nr:quinolinate synthase NadA [Corynebacterium diphtheriae]MBG9274712.1 quinolinate synthase NadA [Corynebacterium diphtheriae bv. mitis]OJI01576.1 quinolinate synthase [Corynebacterium diphtheriae]CAB0524682.1 quinolinate synthase NadA [Corynebacterium diphtheriae]CAB0569903.1 quinolinate synthase NadA [Corynebacterium diphtheriae]CAB0669246.1 quinolinate synthase NadA [Corynebacterium diphtheriae]